MSPTHGGQPEQAPLIVESLADAIRALAFACGGKKALACAMRPDISADSGPDEAARWLDHALDEGRREVLHPIHIQRALRKGREVACDVLVAYICQDAGYQCPDKAVPKSQRTILLEKQAAALSEAARLQRDIDRLDEQSVTPLRERTQ